MARERIYIGNGKTNKHREDIVDVTISMEKAQQFISEYKGKKYLTFAVCPRKVADKYGKTHGVSVYEEVQNDEMITAPTPAEKPAEPAELTPQQKAANTRAANKLKKEKEAAAAA